MKVRLIFTCLICIAIFIAKGQQLSGSKRFEKEVQELSKEPVNKTNIVLFTGSSTIRIWTDIKDYFPGYNIVNRGFGGSETKDLLYFFNALILTARPSKIFIYEGDNDLAAGKSSSQILATTDSLLRRIRTDVSPIVPVYFISPKPSLARWHLKDKYIEHSANLKQWISLQKHVNYVDGWSPLIDNQGNVMTDIFLADKLHLNKKGYQLLSTSIKKYLP